MIKRENLTEIHRKILPLLYSKQKPRSFNGQYKREQCDSYAKCQHKQVKFQKLLTNYLSKPTMMAQASL